MGISVDDIEFMERFSVRNGIPYTLVGDPDLKVIDSFGIRNPDIALAIHSTYIADNDGTIYYRKVGRRRPLPGELLDAVDFHHGNWPRPPVLVEESEITGYHITVARAVLESSEQRVVPAGLSEQDLAVMKAVGQKFDEQEWDPALKMWREWQAERDLPWKSIVRYFAYDRYLSKNPRLHQIVRDLKELEPSQRTPRRVRRLLRQMNPDDRDQVFLLRALVSVLDDITESQL